LLPWLLFPLTLSRVVGIGEICNFAAYAFAPAILVTPLGALSVLIGAVLGSYFLKEELGTLGKLGSAICLIGAVVIVLHAPPDEEIETIDQILDYALRPGKTPSKSSQQRDC
jgi:drug/metabolite transporter (DMT)-like permease